MTRQERTAYEKKRRANNKLFYIKHMGGKCQREDCGYHPDISDVSCVDAMDFHHPNPKDKPSWWGDCISYSRKKALPEIEKTILLCVRCHREEHAYLRKLEEQGV